MLGYLLYYYRKYLKITYLHRIGNSSNAKLPYEFVITGSNPNQHELLKPEFKYVANSIANDLISKEMLLLLIKHILESYGKNKEITDLVDTTRIHFLLSLDPEGFEREYAEWKLENSSLPPKKKKVCDQNETLDSIDLKFPDLITPDTPKSKNGNNLNLMEWNENENFLLSGTLYDGQLLARIPYNTYVDNSSSLKPIDNQLFINLAASYVKVSSF